MSTEHSRVLLALASDPATQSADLRWLARSSYDAVRSEVARNPSCPVDELVLLIDEFPWRVLANPALDLLMLQDPRLLARVGRRGRLALARCRTLTPTVAAALAEFDESDVGLALARNRRTPPAVLARLCVSWSAPVRVAAARNRRTPPSTPALLSRAGATPRLQQFRPCQALSTRDLTRLLQIGEWAALLVASSPACPPRTLQQLSSFRQPPAAAVVRIAVAANPGASPDTLRALAFRDRPQHGEGTGLDEALARNPSTPLDALDALSESIFSTVQGQLALNPSAPPSALARLAGSPEVGVRALARAHPAWPRPLGDALDALGFSRDLSGYPTEHRPAPEAAFELLASTGPWLWWFLLAHPSTPDPLLTRLGARSWGTLNSSLYRLASHPDTDALRLRRLWLFSSPLLRQSLSANPSLPPELRSQGG